MKIVILVSSFPPSVLAGEEISSYNIAKNFALRGHEVHVITTYDPQLPKEYIDKNVFVHRFGRERKRSVTGVIGFLSCNRIVKIINRAIFHLDVYCCIKKINPDIINAQQIGTGIDAFLAKIFLKIPYVIYGHGIYLSDVHGRFEKISKFIYKISLNKSNALILLTEDMKKHFKNDYSGIIHVVPNGIDINRFQNISKKDARNKLGIETDEVIILCVSRLQKEKGIQFLIMAMDILSKRGLSSKLLIIGGDQGGRRELEQMITELNLTKDIQLVGQIPNDAVLMYMVAADIFVLPSLREAFPIVLLESMAAGLPVVCTNVNGLPDVIIDKVNGFLVPPENSEQLADKIDLLVQDLSLRQIISNNNLGWVKQFEMSETVKKLEDIYSSYI